MSIRLICSDIDGTLLQYGKKELESEILNRYGSCIGAASPARVKSPDR